MSAQEQAQVQEVTTQEETQSEAQKNAGKYFMKIKLENTSTGSPKLRRRVVNVRLAFTVPEGGKTELYDQFTAVKGFIASFVNVHAQPIVRTRLERMVLLAMNNIFRPHSTREIKLEWSVNNGEITEVDVDIDFNGYDPPIHICANISNVWYVKVELDGNKPSKYVRSCFSPKESYLLPIDALVAMFVYEAVLITEKVYKVWRLVGEKDIAMAIDGYVFYVQSDPELLNENEETTQEAEQSQQQAQEGQPQLGEAQSQQTQQPSETQTETQP